jgi:hypothetical protein
MDGERSLNISICRSIGWYGRETLPKSLNSSINSPLSCEVEGSNAVTMPQVMQECGVDPTPLSVQTLAVIRIMNQQFILLL